MLPKGLLIQATLEMKLIQLRSLKFVIKLK